MNSVLVYCDKVTNVQYDSDVQFVVSEKSYGLSQLCNQLEAVLKTVEIHCPTDRTKLRTIKIKIMVIEV